MEFLTLETSVGKKAIEPIGVTQVLVTESVGSLNDARVYDDVSIEAPNTTGLTINVVNMETTSPIQNGKVQTSRADDEGFIEVKKKKSGDHNSGTKNFMFSVKEKTQYRVKAKQSTEGTSNSPKANPFVGTHKSSTSCYNKESSSNNGNHFSFSNSVEALNEENIIIEEVATGSMTTTSGTQEGKLVLVDDDGKPQKRVDYPVNLGHNDEVEAIDKEMASLLESKPTGVGYGPESLLEQWSESNMNDDYDPYDDDMYEG
ncbi:hypothetical protein Tco_0191311 [Tanacetum coccineum]